METLSFLLTLFDLATDLTVTQAVTYAVLAWLLTVACYMGFMAYAGIVAAQRRPGWSMTPRIVRSFAWAAVALFAVIDILFNLTVGSLLFLELPHWRRLLFTQRCKYHLHRSGRRGDMARRFCYGFLNPIDPGHC